jgi:hypothetical protein
MPRTVRVHDRVYEISLARLASERVRVHGLEAARVWVSRLAATGGASHLREVLARGGSPGAVSRMTDAEVRDELARRIANGTARLYSAPVPRRDFHHATEEEDAGDVLAPESVDEAYLIAFVEADAEPEMLEPEVSGEAEPEMLEAEVAGDAEPEMLEPSVEADGLGADADDSEPDFEGEEEEAQAAVLQAAAVSGVPFCEECAKAAAAAKPAAAAAAAGSP